MNGGDRLRLQHMLEAAQKAMTLVKGKTRADLDSNELLPLALVRLLEVLGEAARAVSDRARQGMPQIPWKELAGTRNRLIHGYFDVDLDIVWNIVTIDLPPLIATLERLVAED